MRDVRAEGGIGEGQGVLDAAESSEADIQDDIEFALIQMKSETLNRIEEALARLDEGTFGNCFECGDEISERRLRALPFAVRCKDCEEARELAERRERVQSAASVGPSAGHELSAHPDSRVSVIHVQAPPRWRGLTCLEVFLAEQDTTTTATSERKHAVPAEIPVLRCATPCCSPTRSCRWPWRATAPWP